VPVDVAMEVTGMLRGSPRRYFPPFSWFERVAHLVLVEFLRRSFAPELVQARKVDESERVRILGIIAELPEPARKCLEKLTHWTARFLNYSVLNPHAPNQDWADNTDTIKILVDAALVGSEGDGLDGVAWLKNREVGEIVGEFFFGVADNPFRGNEILLPENWDDNVGRMPDAPSSPPEP
jgi:hypothetical protein